MRIGFLALALASAFTIASVSQAGLVTYPNSASWTAAVSGVTNVAIPDPAPSPFTTIGTGSASVAYGGVTFSTNTTIGDGTFFNVGVGDSGDPAVLSSQLLTTGVPNMLVTFPSPVEGFSLNYGTFSGAAVTFTLSNGDTFTQGSTGSGYLVPDFAGATDTTPFTSVLLTSLFNGLNTSTLNLNNVSFASSVSVPEPASLALFGLCAIGLGAVGLGAVALGAVSRR